jgi:hypothetical protein
MMEEDTSTETFAIANHKAHALQIKCVLQFFLFLLSNNIGFAKGFVELNLTYQTFKEWGFLNHLQREFWENNLTAFS